VAIAASAARYYRGMRDDSIAWWRHNDIWILLSVLLPLGFTVSWVLVSALREGPDDPLKHVLLWIFLPVQWLVSG
jgi:hypothetical protein